MSSCNGNKKSSEIVPIELEPKTDKLSILAAAAAMSPSSPPASAGGNGDDLADIIYTIDFAAQKHKNQRRKDPEKTPYINHPIGVANILIQEGGIEDMEVIQAAILHDTVEDTDTTLEELEESFGKNIASIVRELTDDKNLSKDERKELQIQNASRASRKAKLVKMADKIYNLRDLNRVLPEGWTEKRREEYFIWAQKVCCQLYDTNESLAKCLQKLFTDFFSSK